MNEHKSIWQQLLEKKVSRRSAIQGAVATGIAATLPVQMAKAAANNGAPAEKVTAKPAQRAPFVSSKVTTADTITLPRGYSYQILAPWGEDLGNGLTVGFNHDYVGYFPIDMLEGGKSSEDALLTINHEYVNPLFLGTTERTAANMEKEKRSMGVSVMRVKLQNGKWEVVKNDPHNRRIDGLTDIELTGPAAGTAAVKGATRVKGTIGNCSGGQTPWGTLLTCEENVDGYTKQWEGTGYEATHQGWITEIDPFDPQSTPRKHTAMGRFRHENAAVTVAKDGRVVAYMGDDMRDACVYKYVSKGKYNPQDRKANLNLLSEGDLYVADFSSGKWLLLDYDRNKGLKDAKKADGKPMFTSQADILVDARAAALAIKATPTDRPEDIEIHPLTGEVYIALTNNSAHGNYFGQIVKLSEQNDDWTSEKFKWEVFAVGGPQSGFSSPDNLVFDPYGNLWMVTDSGTGEDTIYDFLGNNSMFFFPTEGPNKGKAYRFCTGPVEAEMTGPVWSPDGKTLFLAIQHPGEDTQSLDKPTSTFAALPGSNIPRPTLVAIRGFPGWKEA